MDTIRLLGSDWNAKMELPWTPWYSQTGMTRPCESFLGIWALPGTIAFTVLVYCLEVALDFRQKAAYRKTSFPEELELAISAIDQANEGRYRDEETPALLPQLQDKFVSSQAYGSEIIHLRMISSAYNTVESVALLLLGFLPYIWDKSVFLGKHYFGWNEQSNEIKFTLIFLFLVTILGTITSLPFELYSRCQIQRTQRFSNQAPSLRFRDQAQSMMLTLAIGLPFYALLVQIIEMGGQYFYVYVWGFMFCFSVFMMIIVPVFIMPCFKKCEPLKEGDLKRRIYELADELKFPLTKLFVMDGFNRSSHSNAFMFGFGNNKRIVVIDSLMEHLHDDEVLAIVGHELGHWKLGHIFTNFVVTQLYYCAAFYFFSLCYTSNDLFCAFGFDDPSRSTPIIIALLVYYISLWAPVEKILSFLLTAFSRHCEFAADKFSVQLGMSQTLQSALCKIHLGSMGAMCPDPLYSMYHYSHPPLVERLSAMVALEKKAK